MAEDFNKLSQEQLNKLARVITEAKSLTSRQAEIIEEVIAGEHNVGELRIAYLNKFFDAYSRRLDSIARKQSVLDDAYLILERLEKKAADVNRQVQNTSAELAKQEGKLADQQAGGGTKGTTQQPAAKKAAKKSSQDPAAETNRKKASEKDSSDKKIHVKVSVKTDAENQDTQAAMPDPKVAADNIRVTIDKLVQTCRQRIQSLEDTMSATEEAIYNESGARRQHQIEQYRKFAGEKEKLETSVMHLELLRHQADKDNIKQATNLRITSAQEALSAAQSAKTLVQDSLEEAIVIPPVAERDAITQTEPVLEAVSLDDDKLVDSLDLLRSTLESIDLSAPDNSEDIEKLRASLQSVKLEGAEGFEAEALQEAIKPLVTALEEVELEPIDLSSDLEHLRSLLQEVELESPALTNNIEDLSNQLQGVSLEPVDLIGSIDELKSSLETVELGSGEPALNLEALIAQLPEVNLESLDTSEELASLREALMALNIPAGQDGKPDPAMVEFMVIAHGLMDLLDGGGNGGSGSGSSGGNGGSGGSGGGGIEPVDLGGPPPVPVSNTVTEDQLEQMRRADLAEIEGRINDEMGLRLKNKEEQLLALEAREGEVDRIRQYGLDMQRAREEELAETEEKLQEELLALRAKRFSKELDLENEQLSINELRVANLRKTVNAENEMLDALAEFNAQLLYDSQAGVQTGIDEQGNPTFVNDAGQNRVDQQMAALMAQMVEKRAEEADAWQKMREAEIINQKGELSAEDATKIAQEKAAKFTLSEESIRALAEAQLKDDAQETLKAEREKNVEALKNGNFNQKKEAIHNLTHDSDGTFNAKKAAANATALALEGLQDFAQQLEGAMDDIASHKGPIDTRLQGSKNETFAMSYWDQITKDIMAVGAVTPFFLQKDFAANVESLVDKGIAFDVEQRAFLMTIKDKIATTFDVADSTLLKLVRIQQADSTAARMGMEVALNSFLNNMYETTEYLSDVAAGVRSSLYEMQALMEGAEATEVEFQVQKWMGSLYSVGMSDTAVQSISDSLGKIASGQVEGLTGDGTGNLLIMAANNAGLSIADMLTEGLDASNTNKLLQATVNYLAELAESAKDNKVVQQQLANVFGVKASDLKAATNLVSQDSVSTIFSNNHNYNSMVNQLYSMAGTMFMRTSMAEMMQNVWDNAQYSIAAGMASTPIAYLTYKLAGLMDDTIGGIDLPFLNVYGFGIDLNTTVSDLMRIASMGVGIMGSLGSVISGLGNSFSGIAMLQQMGIQQGSMAVTPRGNGSALSGGGASSTSSSGYVGNASGSDVKDSTQQQAEDDGDKQMIEAEEEKKADRVDEINDNVLKIYELLYDVSKGKETLTVKMAGYGLTGGGLSDKAGAQAGVEALDNASNSSGGGGGAGGSSSSGGAGGGSGSAGGGGGSASGAGGSATTSGNGSGGGRSIDLGGWTMF